MTHISSPVNGTIAPLTNVALFADLIGKIVNPPPHLPRLGLFYGYSGYGKTWSARYAANKHRAFYLECGESWTKRRFLRALLDVLGVEARGTADDMMDKAVSALRGYRRPLIIDEADHIVKRGYIETIRELHDQGFAPIALLGEELLPQNIERVSERTHNRILLHVAAQPGTAEDAAILAQLYHPAIAVAPDLLDAVAEASAGRLRRIVVNLYNIATEAEVQGWCTVDRALWGDRPFFTGASPRRRHG